MYDRSLVRISDGCTLRRMGMTAALVAALVTSSLAQNPPEKAGVPVLPGYRGQIDQVRVTEASLPREIVPLAQSAPTKDLSLEQMAAKAMHYLLHNPLPDHNYECRFDIQLLGLPPTMYPGSRDPYITFGDTESRMDWEFIYMRADERKPGGTRGRRSHPRADFRLHPRRRALLAASRTPPPAISATTRRAPCRGRPARQS